MKTGDEIVRSESERIRFIKASMDTEGQLLEVDVTYKPHSPRPPAHYHPFQSERFEVISGTFLAALGDEIATFEAGSRFEVPVGVPHWMHNTGQEPGRLIWQTRPALNTEVFFETIWCLARDGKTDASGTPDFWQSILIGSEFSDEFRLTKPSYRVQRLAFTLLAPISRLLGYKGTYP